MGNRIKTGVAYVVKLLPIAIELIKKYRGTDEKKDSPECAFPVGEYNAMRLSLGIIGRKCNSGARSHKATNQNNITSVIARAQAEAI